MARLFQHLAMTDSTTHKHIEAQRLPSPVPLRVGTSMEIFNTGQ
jgi:predicted DNA-binding transcriptional regulator AlpA